MFISWIVCTIIFFFFLVNKNPTDTTVCRHFCTAKLLYIFRVSQHSSSGVLKTVPAASGTSHTTCAATPLQRGLIGPGSSVGIATDLWAGRSGIESRWERDFPPVQSGPGAHPGYRVFPRG